MDTLNFTKQKTAVTFIQSILLEKSIDTSNVDMLEIVKNISEGLKLGYRFTENAVKAISADAQLKQDVFDALSNLKGADRVWSPLFGNDYFQRLKDNRGDGLPFDLLVRQFVQYFFGYNSNQKGAKVNLDAISVSQKDIEDAQVIDVVDIKGFVSSIKQLIEANGSIPENAKEAITFAAEHYTSEMASQSYDIPFKENLVYFAKEMIDRGFVSIAKQAFKTATDVLRYVYCLSGGSVDMDKKVKFKLSNPQRKMVMSVLEKVGRGEDFARNRKDWLCVFKMLHIGTYAKTYPKLFALADKLRKGLLKTFQARVEAAFSELASNKSEKALISLVELLASRSGEFVRQFNRLLKMLEKGQFKLVRPYLQEALKNVDVRLLFQLQTYIATRSKEASNDRFVTLKSGKFIKLNDSKAQSPLKDKFVRKIQEDLTYAIRNRYVGVGADNDDVQKVWIDDVLKGCPMPLKMRSNSANLKQAAKGTVLPLKEGRFLSVFVNWEGRDIDIYAKFYDENFEEVKRLGYGGSSSWNDFAAFSGDVTSSRSTEQACELVRIDRSKMPSNVRYATLSAHAFAIPLFNVFAGYSVDDDETMGAKNAANAIQPNKVENATNFDLETSKEDRTLYLYDLKENTVMLVDVADKPIRGIDAMGVAIAAPVEEKFKYFQMQQNYSLYDFFQDYYSSEKFEKVASKEDANIAITQDWAYKPFEVLNMV